MDPEPWFLLPYLFFPPLFPLQMGTVLVVLPFLQCLANNCNDEEKIADVTKRTA